MSPTDRVSGNSISPPEIRFDVPVTVHLDRETVEKLDRIALYEREKRAVLCRRILVDKIQVYYRNPAFKRFLKQLKVKLGEL